jgi:hypothetical protein
MAEVGETDSVVSEGCIQELLEVFSRGSYKARNALDRRNEIIHKRCIHLIARDYDVEVSSELFTLYVCATKGSVSL